MDRTNAPGHVNHLFVAEDPATNRPPTELIAQDFNAHQEEICNAIEGSGQALNSADNTQLKKALLTRSSDSVVMYRAAALAGCAVLIEI